MLSPVYSTESSNSKPDNLQNTPNESFDAINKNHSIVYQKGCNCKNS